MKISYVVVLTLIFFANVRAQNSLLRHHNEHRKLLLFDSFQQDLCKETSKGVYRSSKAIFISAWFLKLFAGYKDGKCSDICDRLCTMHMDQEDCSTFKKCYRFEISADDCRCCLNNPDLLPADEQEFISESDDSLSRPVGVMKVTNGNSQVYVATKHIVDTTDQDLINRSLANYDRVVLHVGNLDVDAGMPNSTSDEESSENLDDLLTETDPWQSLLEDHELQHNWQFSLVSWIPRLL